VTVGPASTLCAIASDGTLLAADGTPTLTLTIAPSSVPVLLAQPGRWNELVTAEGDAGLASTLADLALTLPWLIESTFRAAVRPDRRKRASPMPPGPCSPCPATRRSAWVRASFATSTTKPELAANTQDVRALASDAAALSETRGTR